MILRDGKPIGYKSYCILLLFEICLCGHKIILQHFQVNFNYENMFLLQLSKAAEKKTRQSVEILGLGSAITEYDTVIKGASLPTYRQVLSC